MDSSWIGKTVTIESSRWNSGFISCQPWGNEENGTTTTGSGAGHSTTTTTPGPSSTSSSSSNKWVCRTNPSNESAHIVIERAPEEKYGPNMVAFRWIPPPVGDNNNNNDATNTTTTSHRRTATTTRDRWYLTQCLYGDEVRNDTVNALLEYLLPSFPILPELIPNIADYIVDSETDDQNHEGSGFNYTPMTVQQQNYPPTWQQVFRLTDANHNIGDYMYQRYMMVAQATQQQQQDLPPPHQLQLLGIQSPFGYYWRCEHWNNVVSQAPHCLLDETWMLWEVVNRQDEAQRRYQQQRQRQRDRERQQRRSNNNRAQQQQRRFLFR